MTWPADDPFLQSTCKLYDYDVEPMRALGLDVKAATKFSEYTDFGTVVLHERDAEGPKTTIKVEMMPMPAQFWRFTVTRPRDAVLPDGALERERLVVTTGSGAFRDFWPMAVAIAENCLNHTEPEPCA